MRVRIEFLDVTCRDSEDVTGADTLYIVGGASDGGRQLQPVLTSRLWLQGGQTRPFFNNSNVIFDGDLPVGSMVHLGFNAYDEDASKDWAKHGDWITKLADGIAGEIEKLPRNPNQPQQTDGPNSKDPAQVAAAILRGGVRVIGFFANMDKDDPLGSHTADIAIGNPGWEVREWLCKGNRLGGFLGYSTWDYSIRYRVTQLSDGVPGAIATYGNTIKLRHLASARTLHSHEQTYGHPGSSRQQQVTAFEYADDNDLWVIKGPHGQPEDYKRGQVVQHGDIIRLEHVATRRNLHSHGGIPSPVTGQQEVTCYGYNGIGDDNDNWRVELEAGGSLGSNKRLRLIHVNTNHALHSHYGYSHPNWTQGQQEVTGFGGRDDNDWWSLFEIR
ncbi:MULTISPECIES: MIR domain-containing protein [unclassified Leptolyngbya]|uniref:MIR domain-containing protein n=1 Tax=unclassified Leptolyngbya TaxID=2650499 RepID=UPI001682109F|nr:MULTISPECIES: MIR domain-containing protein [unclassified Leptolyngbya]MBD1909376.1 hypothetical protein [Leptolyngbya sp. FACHB-8]MBD2157612.1 hypothetical protein [Leptolyngbya sp. FACHB-16]